MPRQSRWSSGWPVSGYEALAFKKIVCSEKIRPLIVGGVFHREKNPLA
jgi:hypothetical protein